MPPSLDVQGVLTESRLSMNTTTNLANGRTTRSRHIPGEAGLWVFIMGDMLIFALFFYVFVFYRAQNVELFRQAQSAMNPAYGALFTALLLISSLLVVLAVRAVRSAKPAMAPRLISWASLFGAAFVVVKFFEYRGKIAAGITPISNEFSSFYFVYTGVHLIHVLIGLVVLRFIRKKMLTLQSTARSRSDLVMIEGGACYWHMVDLLWVVLFALLYLKG